MTQPNQDDWRYAEILLDPTKVFVLWAIDVGFCTNLSQFVKHYGTAENWDKHLVSLVSNGYLKKSSDGNYSVAGSGIELVSRLADTNSTIDSRELENDQAIREQRMPDASGRNLDSPPATIPRNGTRVTNLLTINVVDYFQVSAFESRVTRSDWDRYDCRVATNTSRVLRLLEEYNIKATFFVLGWIADHYPDLVKEIAAAGHEIGCHSYWHKLVYDLAPEEFRMDLRQSKQLLEDITGSPVCSFRAPGFSITKRTRWALDILADEGICIDSSIFPIRHDRYGEPDAPQWIHSIETKAGKILEFPMTVANRFGVAIPASGAGYFRLFPYRLSKWLLTHINQTGHPAVFYFSPWEIDPGQPRMPGIGARARSRHYCNLASTEKKLKRLFGDFRFGSLIDLVRSKRDLALMLPRELQSREKTVKEEPVARLTSKPIPVNKFFEAASSGSPEESWPRS